MTTKHLQEKLLEFIRPSYPEMEIEVIESTDNKRHLYFTDRKFADLFQQQRYHNLVNLIPKDFFENELTDTLWHELAPGETPEDLHSHNTETVESMKEIILKILSQRTNFVTQLDNLFLTKEAVCFGDFRHSKQILNELKFTLDEQFDIFHVLMHEGGFCDCEILYNTFKETGYGKKYWMEKTNK